MSEEDNELKVCKYCWSDRLKEISPEFLDMKCLACGRMGVPNTFAEHISTMSDDEMRLLALVIPFNPKVLQAIGYYLKSPDNTIQKLAIERELLKRRMIKSEVEQICEKKK